MAASSGGDERLLKRIWICAILAYQELHEEGRHFANTTSVHKDEHSRRIRKSVSFIVTLGSLLV
jgi:uncharacterized membrane protein